MVQRNIYGCICVCQLHSDGFCQITQNMCIEYMQASLGGYSIIIFNMKSRDFFEFWAEEKNIPIGY